MARTLYLNDGSTEVVIGDQEEVLGRIYEKIADGYYQMLQNALENLDTALKFFSQSRLNRKKLQKCLQEARNDLYNNL